MIGQFGTFFFIVTMGVHTFNSLVLRNRPPQWLGPVVTFIGWTSSLVIGMSTSSPVSLKFFETSPSGLAPLSISSPDSGPLYNIDGFTCGISKSYQVAHMLLYFLPVRLPQSWPAATT